MTQDPALLAAILVVDDEEEVAEALKRLLEKHLGVHVVAATDPAVALQAIQRERFQVAIVDHVMPWMDGVAFLTRLKRLSPRTHRILVTGQVDQLTSLRDLSILEPVLLLLKPLATGPFLARVRALLEPAIRST